jgi:hypothetical protein
MGILKLFIYPPPWAGPVPGLPFFLWPAFDPLIRPVEKEMNFF